MWPFRKRKPTLTAEIYLRWLRAERPDLVEFLKLSELEQEGMASVGDLWRADLVDQALSADLSRPEEPEPTAAEEDEGSHALRIARQTAHKILAKQGHKPPSGRQPPPVSLGGYGDRQRSAAKKRQQAHDAAGTELFGRPPDVPSGFSAMDTIGDLSGE